MVISGILLGNNLVNILSSAVATNLFIKAFGTVGILVFNYNYDIYNFYIC